MSSKNTGLNGVRPLGIADDAVTMPAWLDALLTLHSRKGKVDVGYDGGRSITVYCVRCQEVLISNGNYNGYDINKAAWVKWCGVLHTCIDDRRRSHDGPGVAE